MKTVDMGEIKNLDNATETIKRLYFKRADALEPIEFRFTYKNKERSITVKYDVESFKNLRDTLEAATVELELDFGDCSVYGGWQGNYGKGWSLD